MAPRSTILIANHDPAVAEFFSDALISQAYAVRLHSSSQISADEVARVQPDLLILGIDHTNRGRTLQLVAEMHAHAKTSTIPILFSATNVDTLADVAIQCHYRCGTLLVPCHLDQFYERVSETIDIRVCTCLD